MRMDKIKVFEGDGRMRDERESCFPSMEKIQKRQGQVRNDG